MSHPLYEDDEQVTCMCTKCGWLGTTDAPMFLCGGCKKYLTRPIDLTDRKLKAAEAERDLHIEEINALRKDGDDLHAERDRLQARVAEANRALAPLDAVVHVLGIEDSEDDPAACVKALQASVAKLEEVLRQIKTTACETVIYSGRDHRFTQDAIAEMADRALHREPSEPVPMTLCDSGGGSALFTKIKEHSAAGMRERAAKLTDDLSTGCEVGDGYDYNSGMEYAYRDAGFRIRALTLDGGDGE